MLVLRLGLLTCFFYLVFCAVIDLAILGIAIYGKPGMIGLGGWRLFAFFGVIWCISFYCANWAFSTYMRSKFPH
jgi:hypothetical protein